MRLFKLPDLGEGLHEAEIVEWLVNVGDEVREDDLLLLVETAKAVVEIPSPQSAKILRLCGEPGETIHIGEVLVEFDVEQDDGGTVVGALPQEVYEASSEEAEQPDAAPAISRQVVRREEAPLRVPTGDARLAPSVRAFAQRVGMGGALAAAGRSDRIVTNTSLLQFPNEVEMASQREASPPTSTAERPAPASFSEQLKAEQSKNLGGELAASGPIPEGERHVLTGARRAMASAMTQAASTVALVTIFDEVDISQWDKASSDLTVRLVQALVAAAAEVPALNAWYESDGPAVRRFTEVNVGLAYDNGHALYVPVIAAAERLDSESLRTAISERIARIDKRQPDGTDNRQATISLSNFGSLAGHAGLWATPLVVPPQVAILGAGAARLQIVPASDSPRGTAARNKARTRRILPLSLSFDHRAVTGAEASAFLAVIRANLRSARHKPASEQISAQTA